MARTFKVGDRVAWNSEAGQVSGHIVRVHTHDVEYKGYTHYASADDPQYEIQSDKSDHVAMHKGKALRRIRAEPNATPRVRSRTKDQRGGRQSKR